MKKFTLKITAALLSTLFVALRSAPAFALPKDWQIGFQEAASPVAERIHSFHHMMLWIIGIITIFVTGLMLYVMIRFRAKANPVPSRTTHNVMLEIIWTVIPVVILILMVIPSLKLLFLGDRTPNPEMTLKVTGNQWFWSYEYPDQENISFSSYMIPSDEIDAKKGQTRLLSTDNPVVLPVDTNVQLLVTAADVIHCFTVPALGFKTDAIPGHVNETWVRITKPGTYYGQCSELCGKDHAFMPVEVHAVSKEDFAKWSVAAKKDVAAANKLLK